jgi:hypothetical protein
VDPKIQGRKTQYRQGTLSERHPRRRCWHGHSRPWRSGSKLRQCPSWEGSGRAASGAMGWITTSGLIGYLKAIHITPIMETLSVIHEAGIARNAYSAFDDFLTGSVKNPALACSKITSISPGSYS